MCELTRPQDPQDLRALLVFIWEASLYLGHEVMEEPAVFWVSYLVYLVIALSIVWSIKWSKFPNKVQTEALHKLDTKRPEPFYTGGGCTPNASAMSSCQTTTLNYYHTALSEAFQTALLFVLTSCGLNLSLGKCLVSFLTAGRFQQHWTDAKPPLNCDPSGSMWTCCYHPLQLWANREVWFCHLQV